jgi:hypothetical protein
MLSGIDSDTLARYESQLKQILQAIQGELMERHLAKLRQDKAKQIDIPPKADVFKSALCLLRERAQRQQDKIIAVEIARRAAKR